MPADHGRVEENLRPSERRQPSRLRIPLVPTYANAGANVMSIKGFEPKVARIEIKFFKIEQIVRYVHLAVDAGQMAVGVNHHGGVVIKPQRAAFKQRPNDDDAARSDQSAERLGARPRNRLGQVEVRM